MRPIESPRGKGSPMLNLDLRGTMMNEQNHAQTAGARDWAPLTESEVERSAAVCRLVYRGKGTVIIAGLQFRRVYVFSSNEPEQSVEPEDVDALLRTGLFLIGC